jgi:putative MATE family efflux protein
MNANNKQDKKFHEMMEAPVDRLIVKLAIPSILSMLTTSFYNTADTFFVSKIDTSSTAAVGVTFATMSVIQALGFFFGQGSGTYMSRELGAKRLENAQVMASTSFFYAFVFGLLLLLAGHFYAPEIAQLIGSTPTILPYATAYLSIIMCGAPIVMCSHLMNNHLRFQGSSAFAMVGIMSGGFLNMVLDPLFIFTFHLGVAGAAYATVLSQFVSFCILFAMTHSGGNIPITFKDIHPSFQLFKEIVAGGLPSLFRQGTASVATICLNVSAGAFGDAAIAAMSIVTRLAFIGASVIIGIGQGFQPICGFSYGAHAYKRLREGFRFGLRINVFVGFLAAVLGFIYADSILRLFRDDPLVISTGIMALRAQCISFPCTGLIIISNMTLQVTRNTKGAVLVSAGRSGMFLIPLVLTLPRLFGIHGLIWCQAISDVMAFLLALYLIIHFFRHLPKENEEFAAPEDSSATPA